MLAHRDLSDCWGVLSIILGSLPYSIKQLEVTVVVVLSYINNIVSIYFQFKVVLDKKTGYEHPSKCLANSSHSRRDQSQNQLRNWRIGRGIPGKCNPSDLVTQTGYMVMDGWAVKYEI